MAAENQKSTPPRLVRVVLVRSFQTNHPDEGMKARAKQRRASLGEMFGGTFSPELIMTSEVAPAMMTALLLAGQPKVPVVQYPQFTRLPKSPAEMKRHMEERWRTSLRIDTRHYMQSPEHKEYLRGWGIACMGLFKDELAGRYSTVRTVLAVVSGLVLASIAYTGNEEKFPDLIDQSFQPLEGYVMDLSFKGTVPTVSDVTPLPLLP